MIVHIEVPNEHESMLDLLGSPALIDPPLEVQEQVVDAPSLNHVNSGDNTEPGSGPETTSNNSNVSESQVPTEVFGSEEDWPAAIKSNGLQYSVSKPMIDYILGTSSVEPADYNEILTLWYNDVWDHLINPPANLTNLMFLLAIPLGCPNSKKRELLATATERLEIARLYKRMSTDRANVVSMDTPDGFFKRIQTITTPKETGVDQLAIIAANLATMVEDVKEMIMILRRDMDRHNSMFQTMCDVASSAMRSRLQEIVAPIKNPTGAIGMGTTPVANIQPKPCQSAPNYIPAVAGPSQSSGSSSSQSGLPRKKPLSRSE